MGIRAEELVLIVKAVMKIPGLADNIKERYNGTGIDGPVVSKFCEIIGPGSKEQIEVAKTLIVGERYRRKEFIREIPGYMSALTPEDLKKSIKTKSDAQEIAVAMGIVGDYVDYLETNVWNGPKRADNEGYGVKLKARSLSGQGKLNLDKTYSKLDAIQVGPVINELKKLSKEELIYEVCALYFHLSRVDGGDNSDIRNRERYK